MRPCGTRTKRATNGGTTARRPAWPSPATASIGNCPPSGYTSGTAAKTTTSPATPHGPGLYHIVRDERDPDPNRRYKALFGSHGRDGATSPDGFAWTQLPSSFIPSQDESQFAYDPYTERFLALVKQPTEWGRSVWLATSRDFDHFTAPELIFRADETDWENCRQRVRTIIDDPAYITPPIVDDEDYHAEIYNMAVMPYQGLYIGFPTVFNPIGTIPPPATNFTRINQIEMAVSRDLHTWDRVADRTPFIGIEPWDGENYGTSQLLMAGAPLVREDGEIWIYYNALRIPGSVEMYQRFNRCKELFRLGVAERHFADPGALCLAKQSAPASSPSTATKSPPSSPSPSTGAAKTSTSTPTPAGAKSTPKSKTLRPAGPSPAFGYPERSRRPSLATAYAPNTHGSTHTIWYLKNQCA